MVVVLCTSSYDAYGNTCMKFYEHILNGFKVVEQTWFCYGTANYKLKRDVTKKIHIQELWFLHSACHVLVLNFCLKFYEYILKSSKDIERTWFCQETATQKVQRDVTQVSIQELWFLHSACRLMLVNICMKFHEDTLNGFKVTERTRFCLRNCYLQSSKGHNSKRTKQELRFLRSARRLMLVNICMKFHEGTLNGFWVTKRTQPYRKIYYFQFQRAITPKIHNPEWRILRSARRLMLLYICVKFHENISNGFWITERTWFCDRQTDGRTDGRTDDQGKNNMSHNPTGGDIMRSRSPKSKHFFSPS